MKNLLKFAFATLFVITVFSVSAQSETKVKINPKFGFNVSNFNTSDVEDFESRGRVGWNAGVDVRIGKYLYVAPGLHYYKTSVRFVSRGEVEDYHFELEGEPTIQSLKMPVIVGAKIPIIGIRVQGGIVPSYVLSTKLPNGTDLGTGLLNRFTTSSTFGVGWDLTFITFDLNYSHGMQSFFKDWEARNNTVTLSVGVKF